MFDAVVHALHRVLPETVTVLAVNTVAILGSVVAFMTQIDVVLRLTVLGLDAIIAFVTITWFRQKRKMNALELRKLELEVAELERERAGG